MKRLVFSSLIIAILYTIPGYSQGKFLKNIAKDVKSELLGSTGSSGSKNSEPEPSCACTDAELVIGLGGNLKLDYRELNITVMDDGSLLMSERNTDKYYIAKDGVAKGPYNPGDPLVKDYVQSAGDNPGENPIAVKYKNFISMSGDKYLISFNGKSYGPYSAINDFVVPASRDKFVARVTENTLFSKDDEKKMKAEVENAKTDQEKMELSMKYAQMMQEKMMSGGGPQSIQPKWVSNMDNINANQQLMLTGSLNGDMKYDEILVKMYDGVADLNGKKLISIKPEYFGYEHVFISRDNTKYAACQSGILHFSDGKTLSDLFNARLIQLNGQVYLAYMYYSPKKNAIMQCKIPF